MKPRAIAALFVLSALAGGTSAAQTDTPFVDPINGLTLDQAIARALAQEPSIRAARNTIDVARGKRLQAGLRKNPSLSAELRGEPSGTDNQTMVNVEWPLELFRRGGRTAVADREISAAELAVADRERLLVAEVRGRFGEALSAVRDLALFDEIVDASRRQRDLLRSRVEEGASPPLERDLAEVELRRVSAERTLQLARVERAMIELRRALGATPDDPLRLGETMEEVVGRESVSAAMARPAAAESRTDVREAAARVAVADARIDQAEREGRLDARLVGGYVRMDSGFPQIGLSPAGTPERIRGLFHYVSAGAMVTLPLFNRNQGEIAAAKADRAGAAALQQAAELSARTEIAIARAQDQRAREAVRGYSEGARALARQNLAVVRQSYELGRTTIFEVLAEQKRYLDLERGYTETLRAAYDARTALNRALGETR